jgi:NNP family nitrate/nitrite transporter-like MFS transporter
VADVVLYAIVFGGFVAFSTYLPKYLVTIIRTTWMPSAPARARRCSPRPPSSPARSAVCSPTSRAEDHLAGVSRRMPSRRRTSSGSSHLRGAHRVRVPLDGIRHGPRHGRRVRVGRPVHPADKVGAVTGVVAAGGLGGYFRRS